MRFTHRAIKTIRILSLEELEHNNFHQTTPNLKIIFLLRDPRAVANSRKHITWKKNLKDFDDRLIENCRKISTNLKYLENKEKSSWLENNNNFMTIRYEDFALNWRKILPKIYKLVDLPVTGEENGKENGDLDDGNYKKMLQWLSKHTDHQKNQTLNLFGTQRDAHQTVSKWKEELDWDTIDLMQSACGRKVFEAYGYKFYDNQTHLQQMKELPSYVRDWKPSILRDSHMN